MKLIFEYGIFHFYQRGDGKFELKLPDGKLDQGLSLPEVRGLADACLEFHGGYHTRREVAERIRKELKSATKQPSHGHHCPECGNPWEHKGDDFPCGEPEIRCAKCANGNKAPDLFEETDPR